MFTSTPEGVSVTSTLVSGEKDAILVDPQFLLSESHKVGRVQGDGPNNSFVWIPSIRTVVAGGIVFSGVHFGVPSGNARTEWLKTLDQVAMLQPSVGMENLLSGGAQVAFRPAERRR